MLAIHVELLHGIIRAGSVDDLAMTGDVDRGDWPPSPARLLAALVAADGTRSRVRVSTGAELAVLETAAPPRIIASRRSDVCETPLNPRYVVANATATNTMHDYPARVGTMVRPGTRLAPRSPYITYVWEDLTPGERELAGLRARAARVGYLGCSDSPVRVRIDDHLVEPGAALDTWVPDEDGDTELAVPFAGLTEVLDRMYDEFAAGIPVRRSWYRTEIIPYRGPDYRRPVSVPDPWPTTFWLRLASRLPARRALDLVEALKAATLAVYAQAHHVSPQDMPAILHGHVEPGAHGYQLVQWVALPNVGHEYSDGRIHGVAVMVPAVTDPALAQRIGSAIARIDHLNLRGGRRVEINREPAARVPAAAQPSRWIGPATHWQSALPVVLERRVRGAVGLADVGHWCQNAGFPAPAEALFSPAPLAFGAQWLEPSEVFHSGSEKRPYGHCRIRFDSLVRGPMVLGRGRQFGMGLMAPMREAG